MRVETIDTRHGSLNKAGYSNGNTLPYTGVPFGMNYFAPQNQEDSNWFFDPTYPLFQGIRLTHQPSPWMGDFSTFLMTPITGRPTTPGITGNQTSYAMEQAVFQPHHLKVDLLRYRLGVELTATCRGAKLRFTNEGTKEPGLLLQTGEAATYAFDAVKKRVSGRIAHPINDGKSTLFFYFVLQLDSPVSCSVFEARSGWQDLAGSTETQALWIGWNETAETAELSLGTSFISEEQALRNLQREVLEKPFQTVKAEAAEEWEGYLGKIEVRDRNKQKAVDFNQYLYRMFLFPQTYYELDADNQPIHFDGYSETVREGKLFSNNGFWDTYRTVYPLFSLLIPEKYQEILEGILCFYEESGHLPKWLSPDERGMMPGTLINAVIADAAVKGLLSEEQKQIFLGAMVKEATVPSGDEKFGRNGVSDMLTYGYVTKEKIESVNQTQDNAYSDFCIRQVALSAQKEELAGQYERASLNYRHLIDHETGFMRAKDAHGSFEEGFVPHDWAYEYTEGSAWQNSLAVFHNVQDYIDLLGGDKPFVEFLTKLANEEPIFEIGNYGMEIHEMSELARLRFGQVAVSNQPSFHIPYLFAYAGKPEYTQLLVKQLCEQAFTVSIDGYPGDEDNGSLSGWFIFSMLGFYPVTPGTTQYVMGIPQFDESILHLPNGRTFTISARNKLPQNNFVQSAKLNGQDYRKLFLEHGAIMEGGQLAVRLALLPSERDYTTKELPYSLNNEPDY